MPAFRRVEDCQAGPTALGILVPPGPRTVVILRPRALAWDLLAADAGERGGPHFREFGRDEAAGVARQVHRALEEAACEGTDLVQTVAGPAGGFQVWATLAEHTWIACPREPGCPYRPLIFSARGEANAAAAALADVLCPASDAAQEFYFNTQNFAR
jgi:hypothetical protein